MSSSDRHAGISAGTELVVRGQTSGGSDMGTGNWEHHAVKSEVHELELKNRKSMIADYLVLRTSTVPDLVLVMIV